MSDTGQLVICAGQEPTKESKKPVGVYCVVKNCKNNSGNFSRGFFRFPKEKERAHKWAVLCKREDVLSKNVHNFRICADHFSTDMFKGQQRRGLSPDAYPKIFPSEEAVNLSADIDPLELTTADGLSLFGDSVGNIEFVIESDEETNGNDLGTEKLPFVIEVTELKEGQAEIPDDTSIEVINLDASDEEVIKEEIDIEEDGLQILPHEESPKKSAKQVSVLKKKKKNPRCFVPNCTVEESEEDKILWFKAPYEKNKKKMWDLCIDHPDKVLSLKDVVCSQHFADSDVVYNVSNKNGVIVNATLKEGAVPCIKFHERCCVPFCEARTGPMFCFPVFRNSNFQLWLYMIRNADLRKLKTKDVLRHRVCALHFDSDCFENAFTLKSTAAPTLHLPEVNLNSLMPELQPEEQLEAVDVSVNRLRCAYGDCKNTNCTKKVFKFPKNPTRCMAWVKACKRSDLASSSVEAVKTLSGGQLGVCEMHFERDQFDPNSDSVLKVDAVPKTDTSDESIRQSVSFGNTEITLSALLKEDVLKEKLLSHDNGICSYRGCFQGASENNPFFSFPVESVRSEKWLKACGLTMSLPESRHQVLKNQQICSRHFLPEMFENKYRLKLCAVPQPYLESATSGTSILKETDSSELLFCAVGTCINNYGLMQDQGKFPDPSVDRERFDVWVKLVDNPVIKRLAPEKICEKYVVCAKHFEYYCYEDNGKLDTLNKDAVPTKQMSSDIGWLFTSDFYKNRLEKCITTSTIPANLRIPEPPKMHAKEQESTVGILLPDGIKFPKTGYHLRVEKKSNVKRRWPYDVYKFNKTEYQLNKNVNMGEHIKIHTAIIIDDDDECEKQVLQILLNKKMKSLE